MKELGECLKRTRIKNGVSLTEACEDLDLSTSHIENIESGNVKAFKDVYELRDCVKAYSKYLGLDSDKIVDEFNGFLFQHTSKISLDDIKEAQSNKEDISTKKVQSPYTIEKRVEKNNFSKFLLIMGIVLLFFIIVFIIFNSVNKTPQKVDELMGIRREKIIL